MKPSAERYRIAIPWYEEEDFPLLWGMALDRADVLPDYRRWHRRASAVVNEILAQGRTIQVVTIRPELFLEWLLLNGFKNTAETRKQYVEELAAARVEMAAIHRTAMSPMLTVSDQ